VNGTPKVGRTLGMSTGNWSPSGLTFAYQWLLNGTPISGQTASTLKVTSAYDGKRISVRVTGSRTGYASTTVISAQSAKVTK
jgi:5'-nucleotidase